jgi:flagellar biosynthesis protein FlhG
MIVHQAAGLRPRTVRVAEERPERARVLGIASGKGGVGKSALAVNLATAAAGCGATTLLVDGDLGLANADLLMGVVPRFDLADVVDAGHPVADLLCRTPSGVDLMVVGAKPNAVARLEEVLSGRGAARADELVRVFASHALTLLDLGAGIGRGVIELARHCDPVWLVATPEPTSLADAYTLAKRLWERAPELRIELVVNRVGERGAGERTHRALERMTQRFLGRPLPLRAVLPEDPAMIRAVARQTPVVEAEPDAPIGRRIRLLAESLLEERGAHVGPAPLPRRLP